MTEDTPVGTILFPTAIAYFEGQGLQCNRDMLPGPTTPDEPPWVWGIRVTKQGSNGYKHDKNWLGLWLSDGTACLTVGAVQNNQIATFVRVESVEEAMQKGPDGYGPSR